MNIHILWNIMTRLLRLSHLYLFKEFIKSLVFIIVLLALMGVPSLDHSQGQKSICLFVKVVKESWCSKPGIIVFLKKTIFEKEWKIFQIKIIQLLIDRMLFILLFQFQREKNIFWSDFFYLICKILFVLAFFYTEQLLVCTTKVTWDDSWLWSYTYFRY